MSKLIESTHVDDNWAFWVEVSKTEDGQVKAVRHGGGQAITIDSEVICTSPKLAEERLINRLRREGKIV